MILGKKSFWPNWGARPVYMAADPSVLASPVDQRDGYLIDAYGGVSAMYEVMAPTTDVWEKEQLKRLRDCLVVAMARKPSAVTRCEWVWTANESYASVIEAFGGIPSEGLCKRLRERRKQREMRLMKQGKRVRYTTHLVLGTGESTDRRQPVDEAGYLAAVNSLKVAEEGARDFLAAVGVKIRRMNALEIADYYRKLLRPDQAIELGIATVYDPDEMNFLDTWLEGEIDIAPPRWEAEGLVRWGGTYHTIVSLVGKPLRTCPRRIEDITFGLGFSQVRVTLKSLMLDQRAERDKLEGLRKDVNEDINMGMNPAALFVDQEEARAKAALERSTGAVKQELLDRMEEINSMIAEIRAGKTYIMAADLNIHLWGSNPAELVERRARVLTALADFGEARGEIERYGALVALFRSLPGAGGRLLVPKKYRSRMVADMVPLCRGFELRDRPMALLHSSTGGCVPVDLFDVSVSTAPMAFITGKTGSGKTMLGNLLALYHMTPETRLMVVDYKNSYGRLASLVGAPVVTLDESEPICLNPLQLFGVTADERGVVQPPSPAKRARIKEAITPFMLAEGQMRLEPNQDALLADSLEAVFDQAHKEGRPLVTFSMLRQRLANWAEARPLVEALRPFVSGGEYGAWFDGPSRWVPGQKHIVLEMSGVRKNKRLAELLVPIVVGIIYDECAVDPGQPKLLIFEEMWEHASNPVVVDLIMEAFKTMRSRGAAVVGTTQDAGDLDRVPHLANALKQSVQTWFLFEQGDERSRNYLKNLLMLTEGQMEILRTLDSKKSRSGEEVEMYRECLFRRGEGVHEQSGRLRVEVTSEEYWLLTTNPTEVSALQAAVDACGGDLWTAVVGLARQFPLGMSRQETNGGGREDEVVFQVTTRKKREGGG
jgi:hypothetical protein